MSAFGLVIWGKGMERSEVWAASTTIMTLWGCKMHHTFC